MTAPTHDANSASSVGAFSVSGQTWSHTVGAGSNPLIRVGSGFYKNTVATINVTGVTYAGNALTQVPSAKIQSNASGALGTIASDLWTLKGAGVTAGANNVILTYAAAYSAAMCGADSWFDVDQSTPLGAASTNGQIANATPLVNVTSGSDDIVLGTCTMSSVISGITTSDTQAWAGAELGIFNIGFAGSYAPGGTATLNWAGGNATFSNNVASGVALKGIAASSLIKTFDNVAQAVIKTFNGVASAATKTFNGVANV